MHISQSRFADTQIYPHLEIYDAIVDVWAHKFLIEISLIKTLHP